MQLLAGLMFPQYAFIGRVALGYMQLLAGLMFSQYAFTGRV